MGRKSRLLAFRAKRKPPLTPNPTPQDRGEGSKNEFVLTHSARLYAILPLYGLAHLLARAVRGNGTDDGSRNHRQNDDARSNRFSAPADLHAQVRGARRVAAGTDGRGGLPARRRLSDPARLQ